MTPFKTAVSQSYTQNELEIFERDKEANKWRSATFQSVVAAVKPPKAIGTGGSNQVSPAAFPSLNMSTAYAQNSSRVQAEILAYLTKSPMEWSTANFKTVFRRSPVWQASWRWSLAHRDRSLDSCCR